MDCEQWQEAISAIADDEPPSIDARLVCAHVERCARCAEFESSLATLRRAVAVGIAQPETDLAPRIVKQARIIDRHSAWQLPRIGLVATATAMLAIHAPALVATGAQGTAAHAERHGGAFGVAFAIGLLVVATRPAKARSLLPVNIALAAALLVTAVIDIARGETPLLAETTHLPEVAGAMLVWALAAPARIPPSPNVARQTRWQSTPRADHHRKTA